jgi:hypothetical protein
MMITDRVRKGEDMAIKRVESKTHTDMPVSEVPLQRSYVVYSDTASSITAVVVHSSIVWHPFIPKFAL